MSRRASVRGSNGGRGAVRFCGLVLVPPKGGLVADAFTPCDPNSYQQGESTCWVVTVSQLFVLVPELHDRAILEADYEEFVNKVVASQGCIPYSGWPAALRDEYLSLTGQGAAAGRQQTLGRGHSLAFMRALLAPKLPREPKLFTVDRISAPFLLRPPWPGGARVADVVFREIILEAWERPMERTLPWVLAFLSVYEPIVRSLGYALLGGTIGLEGYGDESERHVTCFTICLRPGQVPEIVYRDTNFVSVLFVPCHSEPDSREDALAAMVTHEGDIREDVADWDDFFGPAYREHSVDYLVLAMGKPSDEEGEAPLRRQYTA